MNAAEAEEIALAALTWLAGEDELLAMFLGASGLSPEDLKVRVADPELLAAVLDFLLMDDRWIRQFAHSTGHGESAPLAARQCLPGGALPNWT
ncbi:MAG: DUF3572 domain-containing protein [Pseudomonadota bacterium]